MSRHGRSDGPPVVSIGLPVYNGADTIADVARSVLAQTYRDLELVISDNASTDGTEEICRELARADPRVVYRRQPENVGLLRNFTDVLAAARGQFFRWIGHDDWLAPTYLARCLDVFGADARLVLVTTQLDYLLADGTTASERYDGGALGSADPIVRLGEMLRLQTTSYTELDPLYGLIRRETADAVPRRRMLREDEIFAAELALAGPWGHVPESLGRRGWQYQPLPDIARRLRTPRWQSRMSTLLQCRELARIVAQHASDGMLSPQQARRGRSEIRRLGLRRAACAATRARRKVTRMPSRPSARSAGSPPVESVSAG